MDRRQQLPVSIAGTYIPGRPRRNMEPNARTAPPQSYGTPLQQNLAHQIRTKLPGIPWLQANHIARVSTP